MIRSFNTTGPCFADEHYMLPPDRRLGEVMKLIEQRKYFNFTARRQTGKTTSLMWIEEHLNKTGEWRALWVDIQTAREQPRQNDSNCGVFRSRLGGREVNVQAGSSRASHSTQFTI